MEEKPASVDVTKEFIALWPASEVDGHYHSGLHCKCPGLHLLHGQETKWLLSITVTIWDDEDKMVAICHTPVGIISHCYMGVLFFFYFSSREMPASLSFSVLAPRKAMVLP